MNMKWTTWWNSTNCLKLFFKAAVGVVLIHSLVSCTENTVPANAVLSMSPEGHTVQVTELVDASNRCVFSPGNYMDIPLVLQLKTADGSPIGNSPILIYADYSENTYLGYPVLGIYDDFNSNGVIDAETEFVSGFDDDIAEAKTGRYSGVKTLLLRVNLSCAFRGEVRAIASGISTSTLVEVVGVSADKSTGLENGMTQ